MVDLTNWIKWDTNIALLYIIISVGSWVIITVGKNDKALQKIKHPKLLAYAASLISCFDLGLLAVVPLFVTILCIYVLEYWSNKVKLKPNVELEKDAGSPKIKS